MPETLITQARRKKGVRSLEELKKEYKKPKIKTVRTVKFIARPARKRRVKSKIARGGKITKKQFMNVLGAFR